MNLPKNMGTTDRVIRIILAVILFALSLTGTITGAVSTIAIIIAAVLLLTSIVGFCPLYLPFRISTRKA